MIICRKAKTEDIPDLLKLCRAFHVECDRRELVFKDKKITDLIQYIIDNQFGVVAVNKKVFCDRVLDEEIIGMMGGMLQQDFFFDEIMASDYVLYVKPEYRGQEAGFLMAREFITWAKAHQVKQIHVGINSGINHEHTVNFYERMGFRINGFNMILGD
jgi:GNAT superfamily N-acetyltransferase